MKKIFNLETNLNGLQLTLISIQEQMKFENQKSLISVYAEKNVADLQNVADQLKTEIKKHFKN
jgi:hypothetical protein